MDKVPEKKPPSKPSGKRNPLKLAAMLPLILPAVAGLVTGLLDGKAPEWWKKLSPKAKGLVLVIAAIVARRKKQLELYGAFMALAGQQIGMAIASKRAAAAPAATDVKGLDDDGPTDDELQGAADDELEQLASEIEGLDEMSGGGDAGPVDDEQEVQEAMGALAHEDMGAIYDELNAIEYVDAA